jgi:hypothetical protein
MVKKVGELNMANGNEQRLEVIERYSFNDLEHLSKFTECLSGAKFMVRKHTDYVDDDGDIVDEADAVESYTSVGVLYTDGDSGVMEFGFSEIYEEQGYQIKLIDCQWCDITPEYMLAINEVFLHPDLYEHGEVEVFESPCCTTSWDSDELNERILNAKKDRENRVALQH